MPHTVVSQIVRHISQIKWNTLTDVHHFIPFCWIVWLWGFDLTSWWRGWGCWKTVDCASMYPPLSFSYLLVTIDEVISRMLGFAVNKRRKRVRRKGFHGSSFKNTNLQHRWGTWRNSWGSGDSAVKTNTE